MLKMTVDYAYTLYVDKDDKKRDQQIDYIKRAYFDGKEVYNANYHFLKKMTYYGEFSRYTGRMRHMLYLCIGGLSVIVIQFFIGYIDPPKNHIVGVFDLIMYIVGYIVIRLLHEKSKNDFFKKMRRP